MSDETHGSAPIPVHPLLAGRRSPWAFSPEPVTEAELAALLEAARWAPSCFNEQPWRFVVARRGEAGFVAMLSCLGEKNQRWAKDAAVLALTLAKRTFTRSGKPNRHALHDVGLAVAHMVLEGEALGIAAHQMAGFSAERAREVFGVPEDFDLVTVVALGRPGDPSTLPEDLAARQQAPRARRPLDELVFESSFGRPR